MQYAPPSQPQYLPLSLDLRARDAFFALYVTSKCWNFLKPYRHSEECPENLTLAIEAASLAYLWHQVYSDTARENARKKYVLALRVTNKALITSKEGIKGTALLASLLLDLYEKITDSISRNNKSWTSHVNGALALVSLQGLESFQHPSDLQVLVCLSGNYIISCIASGSPVPDDMKAVQSYIRGHLDFQDPKLRLLDLMAQYANLRSQAMRGILSDSEYTTVATELDIELQDLVLDLPPRWQYSTTFLDRESDRVFDLYFDSYSDPRVCQARNILRIIRILINQSLMKQYLALPTADIQLGLLEIATNNIETLTGEICACVPQYVDCNGGARRRLCKENSVHSNQTSNCSSLEAGHSHLYNHRLDCYTLIFPLYVAATSKSSPKIKPWVIIQLHHIGDHFGIRNAKVVAAILERGTNDDPWDIHSMLGSYALAA